MTERDEQALRDALHGMGADEPVDLGAVRRRAAERRRTGRAVAGLAVALVLVAGVVGLPRLLAPGAGTPTSAAGGAEAGSRQESGPAAADSPGGESRSEGEAQVDTGGPPPVPDGWRTEYFRDIAFAVPGTWGYAVPPQSDWCADDPSGKPRPDQRRPYVWLEADVPVRAIGCGGEPPASLLTEHVEALAPRPAGDRVEGAVRQGDWWVVTRSVGRAVLVVTTQDRALADQILASARVRPADAPCPARSPVAGAVGTRPEEGRDLAGLRSAEGATICQYAPVEDRADSDGPRLRAAVSLDRAAARDLVERLAAAPVADATCDPAPVGSRPDLAVLVRIRAGGRTSEVFVNPVGCPAGTGMTGGIDDGTTVRTLTRQACSALLTPPVAIWSASGGVARSCLR